MRNSKALLLDYLASVRDPERAASLFADDGVFEMPFLRSLGVEPRYRGRREIAALVHRLLEIYPNFAFAPHDTRILNLVISEWDDEGISAKRKLRGPNHQLSPGRETIRSLVNRALFFRRAARIKGMTVISVTLGQT